MILNMATILFHDQDAFRDQMHFVIAGTGRCETSQMGKHQMGQNQ